MLADGNLRTDATRYSTHIPYALSATQGLRPLVVARIGVLQARSRPRDLGLETPSSGLANGLFELAIALGSIDRQEVPQVVEERMCSRYSDVMDN